VVLENHGEIEATFSLAPNDSLLGSCFSFTPDAGILQPREQVMCEVGFKSATLGEVHETFQCVLQGQPTPLPLTFKGRVVGPSFHFSVGEIDFGTVSMGFQASATVSMYNTSDIPMKFRLRIPEENPEKREFTVEPERGAILPHRKVNLQVHFCSLNIWRYHLALLVDVEGVGEELLALPILADNVLPNIAAAEPVVDFGQCFRRHGYKRTIRILNTSQLKATFELVPQDEASATIGYYSLEPSEGVIDEDGFMDVELTFTTVRMGPMSIPMYVRIKGATSSALRVDIIGNSVGPSVELGTTTVDWGKTEVLQFVHAPLTLTNNSLIPAVFTCMLRKGAASPFSVATPSGTLAAGESRDLDLSIHMDDTVRMSDELILQITDAPERTVELIAAGVGTTVFCDTPLKELNFGETFSQRTCTREFTMENRGRKAQTIVWTNTAAVAPKRGEPEPSPPAFTITPHKVIMEPNSEFKFIVRGLTTATGQIEEVLQCAAVAANGKPGKPFIESKVCATFIQPLIEPSKPELAFTYVYEERTPTDAQTQTVTFTNVSLLPLTLVLRCSQPFSLASSEFQLEPKASKVVAVTFDPGFSSDRQSRSYEKKLNISYREHPQKDALILRGETCFPNVEFDMTVGDFGCVLNDSSRTLSLNITNPSRVAVYYSWSFGAHSSEPKESEKCFDILPIRGCLQPSEAESIQLLFKGAINKKCRALALCDVRGGPEYELPLLAEASAISYKLDRTMLDFGLQSYDAVEEKEVIISNTGRVDLNYQVRLTELSRLNVVEVVPMEGRIAPDAKQRLTVRLLPGLPQKINEVILLQLAHFDPEKLVVMAEGTYPRVAINLPREETSEFIVCLQRATASASSRGLPQSVGGTPRLSATLNSEELFSSVRANTGQIIELLKDSGKGTTSMISKPEFCKAIGALGLVATQESMDQCFESIVPKGASSDAITLGDLSKPSLFLPNAARDVQARDVRGKAESSKARAILEVETEAERLHMLAGAGLQVAEHADRLRAVLELPEQARPCGTVGALLQPLPGLSSDFALSSYVLNFGKVVYGTSKKKSFRVRNMGWAPVSFDVDKKALSNTGFAMTPEKVARLPGLPEPESVDFAVSFHAPTARKGEKMKLGLVEQRLKLNLSPGAPVILVLRANVVMPMVTVSEESVDFGVVQAGHASTVTVVLHNPQEVPAEWKAVPPLELAKDYDFFTCKPSSGVLAPHEKLLLEVTFIPVTERDYSVKVGFKTTNNPRNATLVLKGSGREKKIAVSPSALQLPPVQPYGEAAEAEFSLINPTDYPLEVYVLEFDKDYLEEEGLLRESERYNGETLLLPPRNAGDPMWSDVIEEHERKIEALRQLEQTSEEGEAGVEGAALNNDGVGEVDAAVELAPRKCVVFLGAPMSGFATQAAMVGAALSLPVLSMEELIRSAAVEIRDKRAADERAALEAAKAAATHEAVAEAAGSGDAQDDAIEAADAAVESEIAERELEAVDKEALVSFLTQRLSAEQLPAGFVVAFPEQSPPLVPDATAWRADLVHAFNSAVREPRWTVSMDVQPEVLESRIDAEHELRLLENQKPSAPPDMTEAEYDALTDEDRDAFESVRLQYRRDVGAWEKRNAELSRLSDASLEMSKAELAAWLEQREKLLQVLDPTLAPPPPPDPKSKAPDPKSKAAPKQLPEPPAPVEEVDPRAPRNNTFDGSEDVAFLFVAITAVLPEVPPAPPVRDAFMDLPPPLLRQIIRRPRSRHAPRFPAGFELWTLPPPSSEGEREGEASEEEAAARDDGAEAKVPAEPTQQSRWVVPPRSSVPLLVKYRTQSVGSTQQSFTFEMVGVGADRQVTLQCAASSAQPSISKDYRNVFHRKVKSRHPLKAAKTFVIARNTFEFGPLLVGRERLGEGATAHKENNEALHITNNGPFPLTVNFSFLNGGSSTHSSFPFVLARGSQGALGEQTVEQPVRVSTDPVFFLSTDRMELRPEETQDLVVSAYPDCNGLFEEQLVCTVSDNPEPVLFPVSAIGSAPALAIDSNEVKFERLLLHRTDQKHIVLTCQSALPVQWEVPAESLTALAGAGNVAGQENFTLTPTSGLILPGDSCALSLTFHARQAKVVGATFTVEVRDAASELGVVATLPVAVAAEAYNIDVDIAWPTPDFEGLDFGAFKVVDAQTSFLEVVNRGKYEVGFKLIGRKAPIRNMLTMTPSEGTVAPGGTRQRIEIVLRTDDELSLCNNTDLRIQLTELLTGEILQELAMPVRVTARARFSRYAVVPRGINFGPMIYGVQKQRTFELSNTGEFDFEYTLRRHGGAAEMANGPSLVLDKFTVSPASGLVKAGGVATLTVQFTAGSAAEVYAATLAIDVRDRSPDEDPQGLLYDLLAESCIPGIDTQDLTNIFEEQAVQERGDFGATGLPRNVFAEEERMFCFGSHMVGQELCERFKIMNPFKVSCNVELRTRFTGKGREECAFEVEPKKCTIPPHEYRYVTAFFTPKAITSYSGIFEAEVEQGTDPTTKLLQFELLGEGTLPLVTVQAPTRQTDAGKPLLQFTRLLVGRSKSLSALLYNGGILPATVTVGIASDGVFTCAAAGRKFTIEPKATQSVEVVFEPSSEGQFENTIRISVANNSFEETAIVVKGEAYMQDVVFEDLVDEEATGDVLEFADVEVGATKTISFTLRNNSSTPRRFAWETLPGLTFSPSCGHLQLGAAKQMVATFAASDPIEHKRTAVALQLTKIRYTQPEPPDWDDTMKTAAWLTEDEFQLRGERLKAAATAAAKAKAQMEAEAEHIRAWKSNPKNKGKAPPPLPEPDLATEPEPELERVEPPLDTTSASPGKRHKVLEVDPEPAYKVLEQDVGDNADGPHEMPKLQVAVRCAYGSLECETTSVAFRPTMMFQTRLYSFSLKNTGAVSQNFEWEVMDLVAGHASPGPVNSPFTVSPAAGRIPPGGEQQIQVSFYPEEVHTYQSRLTCHCENLETSQKAPTIVLSGRATRPYCHFEIADSDYLPSGRRAPELPGPDGSLSPLDASTRVIEFESLGTKVRKSERFFVVNPTNVPYEFLWESEQELRGGADVLGHKLFQCSTRKGMVLPGRKFEMVFDFTPQTTQLYESFWRFRIPSLQIDVPFLLVGAITEPNIKLDRTRHSFGPILLGQKARETVNIMNSEKVPFAFHFERASFASGGLGSNSVMDILPASGTISPHSTLPVEITFAPTLEKQFNFNVELAIKSKSRPLVLNLKGEGYIIHDSVLLEDSNGRLIELSSHSTTRVDFGQVHANDKVTKQLTVVNQGRFTFDATMVLRAPAGVQMPPVSITPEHATIKRDERVVFQLSYQPSSDAPLPQGLKLSCNIVNGRSYQMQLLGRGKRPQLAFSSTSHDFGPCFLVTSQNGMAPETMVLTLINQDEHEIHFDMNFEATPFLSAKVSRSVLAPGEHSEVTFSFSPSSVGAYETKVPFLVNGLWPVKVSVRGEGCEMKLELADHATEQQVSFGAIHPLQTAVRSVTLTNRSRRAIDVSAHEAAEQLLPKHVSISFGGNSLESVLRPRETAQLTMRFAPDKRITPFSEVVVLRACGLQRPMFIASGSCVAMDLKLEMDQIAFGQVVLGSRVTRRVMLQNSGDLPSIFSMDPAQFAPDFTVSPWQGFLQPHEDVNLEVNFHPSAVNRDIRYERLPIAVDGSAPVRLTLTGMCVSAEAHMEEVTFSTRVREPLKKSITIKNPSQSLWHIQPIVQDDSWTGAKTLELAAGQSAAYDITYCPMVMTAEGETHAGSVFFPLPDGSALMYTLKGTAGAPQAASTVEKTVPCKSSCMIPLQVVNWLKQPQRFKVDIRAPSAHPSTRLDGHEYVDVPAGASREYQLNFYAFQTGAVPAEIHFLNEKTGEYIFHKLNIKAEAAGVLDTIEMRAPLRQLTTHDLVLSNPLDQDAVFNVSVDSSEVSCPASVTLPAHGNGLVKVEWRPLLTRDQKCRLKVESPQLGTYLYDLKLVTMPTGEQKALHYKAALGEAHTLKFRFKNYLRKAETYKVTLSKGGDFQVAATVAAPAATDMQGADVAMDVTFEPSRLGTATETLTIASADGGEHVCTLHGQALSPKPQGPIAIKAGSSSPVEFKNVFANNREFIITCEPAAFSVAKAREMVPGKKLISIAVMYKPEAGAAPAKGKLTIAAVGEDSCQWIYYLSGQH
jgi:P pilus assembly chaperone PapD